MRRLVLLAALLLVAGCGGDEEPSAAPTVPTTTEATTTAAAVPSTTSPSESSGSAAALGTVDVYTCQSFIADDYVAEGYAFLALLEESGDMSVDLGTPGYIEAYGIGGQASVMTGQQESSDLLAVMEDIAAAGEAFNSAIDSGTPVSSDLRRALDEAADICEAGGFTVDWH